MNAVLLRSVAVFQGLPSEESSLFISVGTSVQLTGEEGIVIFDESELFGTCRGQMSWGVEVSIIDATNHFGLKAVVPLESLCLL